MCSTASVSCANTGYVAVADYGQPGDNLSADLNIGQLNVNAAAELPFFPFDNMNFVGDCLVGL